MHDVRKKVCAGFQNQLSQVDSCKAEHNVNVSVVRRKRLNSPPKCQDHKNAMNTNSLPFAGKFNYFESGNHRGKCTCLFVLYLNRGRVRNCRLYRVASFVVILWHVLRIVCRVFRGAAWKFVEKAITFVIGSHSRVYGNCVLECLFSLLR